LRCLKQEEKATDCKSQLTAQSKTT